MTKTKASSLNRRKLSRDLSVRRVGRFGLWFIPVLTYIFLWVPILVLVVYSFNNAESISVWRGFTLRWYQNLLGGGADGLSFQSAQLLDAVRNSLIVGAVSTVMSTIIGTLFALAVARGDFPGKRVFDALFYLPVIIPRHHAGRRARSLFQHLFCARAKRVRSAAGQRLCHHHHPHTSPLTSPTSRSWCGRGSQRWTGRSRKPLATSVPITCKHSGTSLFRRSSQASWVARF